MDRYQEASNPETFLEQWAQLEIQFQNVRQELEVLFQEEYQALCCEKLEILCQLQERKMALFESHQQLLFQLEKNAAFILKIPQKSRQKWMQESEAFLDKTQKNKTIIETFLKEKQGKIDGFYRWIQKWSVPQTTYQPQTYASTQHGLSKSVI